MTEVVTVTITGPSEEWLADHVKQLLEKRLIACANIIPRIRAIYRWQNQTEDETETLVLVHTQQKHVEAIIDFTNKAHPYDTVQILATKIIEIDQAYKQWVVSETD